MSHDWFNNVYQSTGKSAHDIMGQIELMLEALKSSFFGAGFPSDPVAGMICVNTTDHCCYMRNEANDAWVYLFDLSTMAFNIGAGMVATAMLADAAVAEAKIGSGAVTEGKIGPGAVTDDKITAIGLSRNALKTSSGSSSGTGTGSGIQIVMQDYTFFPSIITNSGNILPWGGSDQSDTVGRFNITVGSGYAYSVRWRYITSSDKPFVYAIQNNDGVIEHIWSCEDPPPPYWGMSNKPANFKPPLRITKPDGTLADLSNKKEITIFDYGLDEYHALINRADRDKTLLHEMLNNEFELPKGSKIFERKNLAMI